MPIDNIAINGTSAMGNQLKNLMSTLFSAKAQAAQILQQMQEQNDGTTYTQLETQYGIPTGQGTNVYAMVFALANGNPASPSGFGTGAFTQIMGRLN